jgi:hypothetical protein
VTLLAQLGRTASALGSNWDAHFARDYAFRELKSNRAILLGTSRSNPRIEQFESQLGIRWVYDAAAGIYYPAETWAGTKLALYLPCGDRRGGSFSRRWRPHGRAARQTPSRMERRISLFRGFAEDSEPEPASRGCRIGNMPDGPKVVRAGYWIHRPKAVRKPVVAAE